MDLVALHVLQDVLSDDLREFSARQHVQGRDVGDQIGPMAFVQIDIQIARTNVVSSSET